LEIEKTRGGENASAFTTASFGFLDTYRITVI